MLCSLLTGASIAVIAVAIFLFFKFWFKMFPSLTRTELVFGDTVWFDCQFQHDGDTQFFAVVCHFCTLTGTFRRVLVHFLLFFEAVCVFTLATACYI